MYYKIICSYCEINALAMHGVLVSGMSLIYYSYNISHPTKYGVPQLDLSGNEEAKIDPLIEQSFSLNQLSTERVMVKIICSYCEIKYYINYLIINY